MGGREPQSVQSLPYSHDEYSPPGPPSSQSPSLAYRHVSLHAEPDDDDVLMDPELPAAGAAAGAMLSAVHG